MFKFSKKSLKKLEGLHPNLQKFFKELIKISPYDFSITQGVRTAEEQNKFTSKVEHTWKDCYKLRWVLN